MSGAIDVESVVDGDPRGTARRLAIQSPYLFRMQRRHFLLFNAGPLVGTSVALAWAFVRPIGALELGLFGAMWLLTGLGVSAGYHRFFTHRSFKAGAAVRVALVIMGSMAALGPVISWAAMHRRHHRLADRPGDMHSPNLHGAGARGRLRGLLHAHVTWMIGHEYPNVVHYVPDLIEDRVVFRASRLYRTWILLGLAIPAAIGALVTRTAAGALAGLLWGGVVRMFVVGQSISALNSILHTVGSRPFPLEDNSRNNPLLGLLIWGEGWHHNHHAFPRSASFALAWYRVDLSYWFIRLLERLGLAWDVMVPTREQTEARSARVPRREAADFLERSGAADGS